jgi:hypothetical protein
MRAGIINTRRLELFTIIESQNGASNTRVKPPKFGKGTVAPCVACKEYLIYFVFEQGGILSGRHKNLFFTTRQLFDYISCDCVFRLIF